ncbi:MAG: chloride channel protein [Huintestinicola sp.]
MSGEKIINGINGEILPRLKRYGVFFKWMVIAVAAGIVIGVIGSVFHICLEHAAELRSEYPWLLWLLPAAGVVIVWLYHVCGMDDDKGTNGIIMGARGEETVSIKKAPLIFAATFLTHLTGGSAGREGAALQLGGSLVSPLKAPLKMGHHDYSMLIMCGMAAGFSALFGTPAAAAVFAIEVTVVGFAQYSAIVPCLISAITAAMVSDRFGLNATAFYVRNVPEFDYGAVAVITETACIGILASVVSILFCKTISGTGKLYRKLIPNPYIRAAAGGCIVILLTFLCETGDYNGAGVDVINRAFNGSAAPEAFIMKLIFTALTLGAGFKGGEIVPALFVGSTFGCVMGDFIGINPSFGAALGLAAVFCGVTNCPLSSLILTIELFGRDGMPYYALVIGIAYMLSGYDGLYSAQKFYEDKLTHHRFHGYKSRSEIKSDDHKK